MADVFCEGIDGMFGFEFFQDLVYFCLGEEQFLKLFFRQDLLKGSVLGLSIVNN